jgi:hypothetical protein
MLLYLAMEKFSSFRRVVGAVSELKKQEILDRRADIYAEQDFPEIEKFEREKTPEEQVILELANNATNELLKEYEVEVFSIPDKNIHIIPEKDWQDDKESAFYDSMAQAIAIREAPAKVVFLKTVFHEMLHFKSYNAMQVISDAKGKVNQYRVGLTVITRDGEKKFFKFLNEAVTEELTKRFVARLFDNPLFSEERKRTAEIMNRYPNARTRQGRKSFDDEVFYADTLDDDTWKDAVGRVFGKERNRIIISEGFSYKEERDFLSLFVDRLYQKNYREFDNREEIFDLFAQAALSGNLLRIGKLIDRTFGIGTFCKIGEMGNDQNVHKEMFDLLQIDL